MAAGLTSTAAGLAALSNVPHVLVGEIIAELGRVIVCVPDESDVAALWAVAGPAVGAAHLGPCTLRALAVVLLEAATVLETAQQLSVTHMHGC